MGKLLQLRDALALLGQADTPRLSAQLNLSVAMTEAMLEQLVSMGQVERIADAPTGGCKHCPQKRQCRAPAYRLVTAGR
ncbi:FeoC-like transcriptional regulator [Sodalis ligni]|uniref:Ferrous iron transport protein C n=1 Tax=Sodalis ligni TaxID=2697027 RepID=A0A4R1NDT8_9GAMM|nr:FeoC-like transcriptional regulator [Sodalis ligni]TCL04989.1 ferrous iron transport protein C [Sodalis ligni]